MELYLYSSTHLHEMGLNSAQKQIFLKTEISSLAKNNSYCNRNGCHISCKTVTCIFQVLGFCEMLPTVHQMIQHNFPESLNLQRE
jgi:hypothetical protein